MRATGLAMIFVAGLGIGGAGAQPLTGTVAGIIGGPGPHVVQGQASVAGIITGDIDVSPGAHVTLGGRLQGSVVVRQGAIAAIGGTIQGDVVGDGGDIEFGGTANQVRRTSAGGKILVKKDSVVGGRKLTVDTPY